MCMINDLCVVLFMCYCLHYLLYMLACAHLVDVAQDPLPRVRAALVLHLLFVLCYYL